MELKKSSMPLFFYSREQRAKRTCLHVHLAVLCADGTRLAPTEVERRLAARVFDLTGNKGGMKDGK